MSEMKYTPGPWTARKAKYPVDGSFDWAVTAEINDTQYVVSEAFGRVAEGIFPNAEANAHLISAAPDMFEALKKCQKALAMMVAPGSIEQTSVAHAFAVATEAEVAARAALQKATPPEIPQS